LDRRAEGSRERALDSAGEAVFEVGEDAHDGVMKVGRWHPVLGLIIAAATSSPG
jgi:hypothetical protein